MFADKKYIPLNAFPLIIPALILLSIIQSCSVKPKAEGELDHVQVFADKEVYSVCWRPAQKALEKQIDTPQPETVFMLEYSPWDKFAELHTNANIMLMGTLEGEGPVSGYIRQMLDANTLKGVTDGVYWLFNKTSPWSNGQLLIIVVANDPAELATRLEAEGEELFSAADKSSLQRLTDKLFSLSENREMEEGLQRKYGFSLRIQKDYSIVHENPEERLIRLRKSWSADRFLTISWSESPQDSLTQESVLAERIRISGMFEDKVRIYTDYNRFSSADDLYPGALLLRGLWGLESNMGGGPFFTIALRDSATGIVYFLDGAVFAPDRSKMPFLRQLEAIARTFQPPLNPKKSES